MTGAWNGASAGRSIRRRGRALRTGVWLAAALMQTAPAAAQTQTFSMPSFGAVAVYAPARPPEQVVLFVSGDGGWNLGVVSMAERLRQAGALVAGIDIRRFLKSLESSGDCAYPAGPLEELARAVESRWKVAEYRRPILVGYSSGATLVYAALAAAPANTFAGAISLGFCPDLEMHKAPCQLRGLKATKKTKGVGYFLAPDRALSIPWMILQGEIDQVCAPAETRRFAAATGAARVFSLPGVGHGFSVPKNWEPQMLEAYRAIATERRTNALPAVAIPGVGDLPLIEVPAGGPPGPDVMAVLLSGDGGWADLDREVAAGLSESGVPVIGWDSLRYFWKTRTPESAAADLAAVIAHYQAQWKRARVILIGYSFGADVMPFLATRLPPQLSKGIERIVLLGLSDTAAFEFHLSSWLGGGGDARFRTAPEIRRLAVPVTCVRGDDEPDSGCAAVAGPRVTVATVGRGHHFGGDYRRLLDLILNRGG